MPTITVNLPAPHAAQRKVLDEAKRFNVLSCGRRFGKTTLAIDRLVEAALHGLPVAWFSPTYRSLGAAWRDIQTALEPVVIDRSQAEFRLELTGGGIVECWSLDGENTSQLCRGRKYARIVVDEAAQVRGLLEVWEGAIRPTLTDFRGDAWFLSTPRGHNDFKTLFDRGQDPLRREWMSWCMPTVSNPHIDGAEVESARRDMTEGKFHQEYLALFCEGEGQVFRRIDEAINNMDPSLFHNYTSQYVIGVDWGRSHDYTVMIVLDKSQRPARMVEMVRSNKLDYAVQRDRLWSLYMRWKPETVVVELNSIGQPIFEQLRRDGLPVTGFTTTNQSKAAIIEALALAFERKEISILGDPVLIAELQAFTSEVLPGGLTRYSAPGGRHDDCVMALALALNAAKGAVSGYRCGIMSRIVTGRR